MQNSDYLFCHKALAKVFRAKMLDGIKRSDFFEFT